MKPQIKIKQGRAILPDDYRKAEMIIDIVCEAYGISKERIRLKSKEEVIIYPRQVAMYLIRLKTGLTFKTIGAYFGKNHATVMHACTAIGNERTVSKMLDRLLIILTKKADDKFKQT